MTSLKKNFIYNIAYQILLVILPLITAPYVSRVLGVDGIGTYSYIYSIAYYFGLCGMLGVSNHGNRSVALAKHDRKLLSETFYNIYAIQLLTTVVALVIYICYMLFFFNGNRNIGLIAILFVISYVLDINWFYFGLEQFKLTVTRNVIVKLTTVICTFIFVKDSDDLWKYTLILALGMVFSQVYLWINMKKHIDFTMPKWSIIKSNIKPMLILFIPVIAYSIYKVMDKIMLGALTSVTQVGLYENADKIINIPVGIITAFGTVMMPRISSLVASNDNKQIQIYSKLSFKYFSIMAIGMAFGLIGVSDVLAPVYFGDAFAACSPIIAGLSVTLIFMTWANIIRTQYLIPNKKDKPYVAATIAGAIVNLIANIIFIPIFQAVGALIGTVLAEFTVFLMQALMVRKEFPVARFLKSVVVYFLFGIAMTVIVRIIGVVMAESVKTLIVQVLAGASVYCLAVGITLYVTKDRFIMALLQKFKLKK